MTDIPNSKQVVTGKLFMESRALLAIKQTSPIYVLSHI